MQAGNDAIIQACCSAADDLWFLMTHGHDDSLLLDMRRVLQVK